MKKFIGLIGLLVSLETFAAPKCNFKTINTWHVHHSFLEGRVSITREGVVNSNSCDEFIMNDDASIIECKTFVEQQGYDCYQSENVTTKTTSFGFSERRVDKVCFACLL